MGDALGADTEFMDVGAILRRYPPRGPNQLTGDPIRVTDDTQMALAVGRALLRASTPYTAETFAPLLIGAFVAWMKNPENNRAPGMTCMRACRNLELGFPWAQATVKGSKGCGANMRVAPVGVLTNVTASERAALAQFQAAVTHGHPTALAAADLTSATIADLVAGGDLPGLLGRLRGYAHAQRTVWHADWLGSLWESAFNESPETYIARGWDECLGILDRVERALQHPDRNTDPCQFTGAGWVAEEAFGTALLCFLLFPDDPIAAIQRAAVTSGDSDSIACLAGAFAGAYHGLDAWPREWIARMEYRDQLQAMCDSWENKHA